MEKKAANHYLKKTFVVIDGFFLYLYCYNQNAIKMHHTTTQQFVLVEDVGLLVQSVGHWE